MPSGYASAVAGPTHSTPVNVGTGAFVVGASNSLTASQAGLDASGLAFGVTMIFQWVKQFSWFEQNKVAPLVLLLLGIDSTLLVYILAHKEIAEAIPKGCWVAWQAMQNYVGQKTTGLGGLAPAN